MSYKFQRLRERLRQAVLSGELTGKLPGERALAKRYNCNAKTLSKALTDLAAEGLLERSIGRGTYVKGSAPAVTEPGPWLVLSDGSPMTAALFQQVMAVNPRCQLVVGEPPSRPSFINQFSAVIDVSATTPDAFVRDLVVRGVPVVVVGRESRVISVDTVLVDIASGVQRLARELMHLGHRRFLAVESVGHTEVSRNVRQALATWANVVTVDAVAPREVLGGVAQGATAVVCESPASASEVLRTLREAGIDVPGQVSVVAVGVAGGEERCSGAYVPLSELLSQAVRLLEDRATRRPAILWLAPSIVQHGTFGEACTQPASAGLNAGSEVDRMRLAGLPLSGN